MLCHNNNVGRGDLVASVRGRRAQSTEFESRPLFFKYCQVAKDHPHAVINTILDWDCNVKCNEELQRGARISQQETRRHLQKKI